MDFLCFSISNTVGFDLVIEQRKARLSQEA